MEYFEILRQYESDKNDKNFTNLIVSAIREKRLPVAFLSSLSKHYDYLPKIPNCDCKKQDYIALMLLLSEFLKKSFLMSKDKLRLDYGKHGPNLTTDSIQDHNGGVDSILSMLDFVCSDSVSDQKLLLVGDKLSVWNQECWRFFSERMRYCLLLFFSKISKFMGLDISKLNLNNYYESFLGMDFDDSVIKNIPCVKKNILQNFILGLLDINQAVSETKSNYLSYDYYHNIEEDLKDFKPLKKMNRNSPEYYALEGKL